MAINRIGIERSTTVYKREKTRIKTTDDNAHVLNPKKNTTMTVSLSLQLISLEPMCVLRFAPFLVYIFSKFPRNWMQYYICIHLFNFNKIKAKMFCNRYHLNEIVKCVCSLHIVSQIPHTNPTYILCDNHISLSWTIVVESDYECILVGHEYESRILVVAIARTPYSNRRTRARSLMCFLRFVIFWTHFFSSIFALLIHFNRFYWNKKKTNQHDVVVTCLLRVLYHFHICVTVQCRR